MPKNNKKQSNTRGQKKSKIGVAKVSRSIIQQTSSFLSHRGRLEMGGLLIGHVDEEGNNICSIGFFPEQLEETPGYCKFDGKFVAITAGILSETNEEHPDTPNLRIIGWIHTHPDIPIFLSDTDNRTFSEMLSWTPDGRFVAVVVDPLRDQHGVFEKPRQITPSLSESTKIDSEPMIEKYLTFLEKLEEKRDAIGKQEIPFILTGQFRSQHTTKGFVDDYEFSILQSIHSNQSKTNINSDKIDKLVSELEKTNKLISTKYNKLEKESKLRIEAVEKNLVKISENIEVKISEEIDKINQIILQDDLAKDELRFRIEHLVEFVKLGPIVMEIIDCSEDELRSGAYIDRIYKNNQKKNKINLLFEGIQNYTGDPIPAYEKLA